MLFYKFLRALLKAWGRKPKGTTVWELLKEIIEGLPFGVKTEMGFVEVFNSGVGGGMGANLYYRSIGNTLLLKENTNYKVSINGEEFTVKSYKSDNAVVVGGGVISNISADLSEYSFSIKTLDNGTTFVYWNLNYGISITLVVCEEQEVEVTQPIDYKFMPEGYPKVEKKMVEIVPEQTLTSGFDTEWKEYRDDYLNFELKVGAKYTVIINGETLIGECFANNEAGDTPTLIWGEYGADKFVRLNTWDANATTISWGAYYGSPITLKIIEEAEVVEPLDPKFVGASGGATVFYVEDATVGVEGKAQLINADGSNVTFEQAKEAGDNVVIFDKTYSYYYRPLYRQESGNSMWYVVMGGSTFTVKDSTNINQYVPHMCYCCAGDGGGGGGVD